MSIAQGVLTILGSVLMLGVGYYFKGLIRTLYQAYQDRENMRLAEQARKQTQADDQKANADSDALKKLDGR